MSRSKFSSTQQYTQLQVIGNQQDYFYIQKNSIDLLKFFICISYSTEKFMDRLALEKKNIFLNRALLDTFSLYQALQQSLSHLQSLNVTRSKLSIALIHNKICHLKSENHKLAEKFLSLQLQIHQISELQIILKLYQQKISEHRLILHNKSNCLQQIIEEKQNLLQIDYFAPRTYNLRKFTIESIGRSKLQKLLNQLSILKISRNNKTKSKDRAIPLFLEAQNIEFPKKTSLFPWGELKQLKERTQIQQTRQKDLKEKYITFKSILNILKQENKELKMSLYNNGLKDIEKNNDKINIRIKKEYTNVENGQSRQNKQSKKTQNQSFFSNSAKIDKTVAFKSRNSVKREQKCQSFNITLQDQ